MGLISISIDLCGSTSIKQKIIEISNGNEENVQRLYGEYAKLLFLIEKSFYRHLKNKSSIDFEKLFLVKGIGDELWFLYDTDKITENTYEHNQIFFDFFISCVDVLPADTFYISENDIAFGEWDKEQTIKHERLVVPKKIYLDLVRDCEEISKWRFDFFKDYIHELYTEDMRNFKLDEEKYNKIIQNLNVGTILSSSNGKTSIAYRTDFIGIEIDRFFRASKYALPGILTCGQSLIESLSINETELNQVKETAIYTNLQIPHGNSTHRKYDYVHAFKKKTNLKGLSESYTLYYLFLDYMINGWILLKPDFMEDMYEVTRKELKSHGYEKLNE